MSLGLRLLILGFLLSHAGCRGSATAAYVFTPGKNLRVLFIGNSLTQSNDLPAIVQALAVAGGQPRSRRNPCCCLARASKISGIMARR